MPDFLSEGYWEKASGKRKKKARAGRLYTRVNPDTGAKLRMSKDDPRWDDTMTVSEYRRSAKSLERSQIREEKAQAREEKKEKKEREKEVKKIALQVGKGVGDWITSPGTRESASTLKRIGQLPVGRAVKLIGKTPAIATVLLAGTAAYYATTWIMDYLAKRKDAATPSAQRFAAAMAYREARKDAEAKLKRPLNAAEHEYLAAQFKAKLASIPGV